MDDPSSDVAVELRTVQRRALWLGRPEGSAVAVVILDGDVREGRPLVQHREFAKEVMEKVHAKLATPRPNLKIVFPEHDGSQLMGGDRIESDWADEQ